MQEISDRMQMREFGVTAANGVVTEGLNLPFLSREVARRLPPAFQGCPAVTLGDMSAYFFQNN